MREWLWIASLAATMICFAMNVYTWRVAYPLWRFVGDKNFAAVHREYMQRLDLVITGPHVFMFFASAVLLRVRPEWYSLTEAEIVFALETMVILVSAFVAGPIHSRFTKNGVVDEPGMIKLVRISVFRSVLMMIASGLMLNILRIRL